MDERIDEVEKLRRENMQESFHLFNKSGGYRRDNK